MPAVTATTAEEQNEADQKMWSALKRYIVRERQRKKEGEPISNLTNTFDLYLDNFYFTYFLVIFY